MKILAVGCHPDDLEIGCGGTLARYARRGDTVVMCLIANGNRGHTVIRPEELRAIRGEEAQAAGMRLGAVEVVNLDVPDLEVNSADLRLVTQVVQVIRRVQPHVVITHAPEDYMRDHVEVSKLVFDASFSASVPHFAESDLAPAPITPLYYMDTLAGVNFLPSEYVDITETMETKLSALSCHASQVRWLADHDGIDFLDFVRTVSRFRGLQCGTMYAEAFRPCQTWPRLTAQRLLP